MLSPPRFRYRQYVPLHGSLLPALKALAVIIRKFGAENSDVIKTARTHLMDALPIRLQSELEGWAVQLDECVERIEGALPRMSRLPLGGTAVGSGINCHPDFPAKAIAQISEINRSRFHPDDFVLQRPE